MSGEAVHGSIDEVGTLGVDPKTKLQWALSGDIVFVANSGNPGSAPGSGGSGAAPPTTGAPTPVVPDESEPPFDSVIDEDAGTP